jgi:hypothetical protein
MDFSDRNAKLNKRLMESWGYDLNEKKGFGEGTPPEGEWYDKKVIVMEDGSLDHPGMCCADAHSGQEHGAWATAQQQGRTEAPAIVSLEEDDNLEEYRYKDEPQAEKYKQDQEAKGGGRYDKDWRKKKEADRKAVADAIRSKSYKEGLEEGELPPWLDKKKKDDDGEAAEDDDDIVPEKEDDPGVENERKKRDEPRNYVGRPGHVQNPLHEHEELVKRVVERVVARLQKS